MAAAEMMRNTHLESFNIPNAAPLFLICVKLMMPGINTTELPTSRHFIVIIFVIWSRMTVRAIIIVQRIIITV